jgi:U3 small nucleolar RNA-associated protein 7
MRQNPYNASEHTMCDILDSPDCLVMHLGHKGGAVTLWTPNMSTPVVKALCHRGPVQGASSSSWSW